MVHYGQAQVVAENKNITALQYSFGHGPKLSG